MPMDYKQQRGTVEIIKLSKLLLLLAGLLPPTNCRKSFSTIYYLYTICNAIALAAGLVGCIIIAYLCRQDLQLMTCAIFWLLGNYIVLSNLLNFISKRKIILRIVDDIQTNHVNNINKKYLHIVKKGEKAYLKALVQRCVYCVVLFMYIIITQIALSGERGSEKQEDKNVVKYRFILEKMPIMIWIPFDVENDTTVFVTMYAAACLLGVIVSLVDISTDIANYALGTHLSAQFEILCAMLEDVEENVLVDNIFQRDNPEDSFICNKLNLDVDVGKEVSNENEEKFEKYLKMCIKKHQQLYEISTEVNYIITPAVFFLSAIVPLTVCGPAFIALKTDLKFVDATRFAAFVFLVISKMLVYCLIGEELQQQSQNVKHSIYSTKWFNRNPRYKKLIIPMIMRSDKPATLTAWIFNDLSLETFGNIMNKAYTYFTFLLNFTENEETPN